MAAWRAPRLRDLRPKRRLGFPRVARVLTTASLLGAGLLGTWATTASAQGSDYFVTFVARSCPAYTDIFANRARNDILESLKDLGPDSQYGNSGQLVNPTAEGIPPQDRCVPLPGWEFTIGTGFRSRYVTGPWGSLSNVTNPFREGIVTEAQTPLLNQDGVPDGHLQLAGATTIELTPRERTQAASSERLWAQGGTRADPVLAQKFPGPAYGFGALRCATDDLNGDNVEYIFFPAGVRHVFCYGLYVRPSPTSGTITIAKHVTGAPAGDNPTFPFDGSISYDPNGFQLAGGGAQNFYRAGGATWTVTEGAVANYRLADLSCTAQAPGGGPGTSTVDVSETTASIHLVAGEHVTCVYTNSYVPPHGGLTIRKITHDGVGHFRYLVTPVSGNGEAHHAQATTTEPNVAVDAEPSPLSLAPGRYQIRELQPSSSDGHWHQRQVDCSGATESATHPVEVDVASGESVTCTFTNEFVPRGSISLAKITENATGIASFLIAPLHGQARQYAQSAITTTPGVAAPAVPRTPLDATDHLRLGPYRITEQLPASTAGDWALTAVKCNGLLVPFAQGMVDVALTRADPSVHCVYTNTFSPTPPPPPPSPLNPPPVTPPPAPVFPEVPGRPEYPLSDLVVTKHASAATVTRGGVVSYRITVTNLGPDPAQSVVLNEQPLGHTSVVSVHTNTGRCQPRLPTICKLGTLGPRAKATVTLRVRVLTAARIFINRAVAGTSTQDATLANNTASALIHVHAPRPPAPPLPPPPVGLG
jgi:uncharacterized repeat protein (TIGR01451 family)